MRRIVFMLSVFFSIVSAADLFAGEEAKGLLSDLKFEVWGEFNFSSIYMWRGIMLDGDPVAQPGIYIRSPLTALPKVLAANSIGP